MPDASWKGLVERYHEAGHLVLKVSISHERLNALLGGLPVHEAADYVAEQVRATIIEQARGDQRPQLRLILGFPVTLDPQLAPPKVKLLPPGGGP